MGKLLLVGRIRLVGVSVLHVGMNGGETFVGHFVGEILSAPGCKPDIGRECDAAKKLRDLRILAGSDFLPAGDLDPFIQGNLRYPTKEVFVEVASVPGSARDLVAADVDAGHLDSSLFI